MADEDQEIVSDGPVTSSEDDNSESETEPELELMVSTRERRTTAGNRYNHIVGQEQEAQEADDDDVALLFAEAEGEDEEYQSDDPDDDADMSSSDDDDQGPTAGGEELEGEKEIESQAKVERTKKRKADMALTTVAGLRKKPKFDPTALHRAPERPKPSKRKERVSWLPEQNSAPGRVSLRKQTIAHRAVTHARLKENEQQRIKLKKIREQKERERGAEAPREMTQADRLAEAERVERRNAKSLNRWEAMEKKRAEEQAAKLAALKDRKLQGPVLTWHSTTHTYQGLKPERSDIKDSNHEGHPEGKKRGRKSKAFHEQRAAANAGGSTDVEQPLDPSTAQRKTSATETPQSPGIDTKESLKSNITIPPTSGHDDSLLTGIHEFVAINTDTSSDQPQQPQDDVDKPQGDVKSTEVDLEKSQGSVEPSQAVRLDTMLSQTDPPQPPAPAQAITEHNTPEIDGNVELPTQEPTAIAESQSGNNALNEAPMSTAPPPSVIEVVSTRNVVVLENFDEISGEDRQNFSLFYNQRKGTKPSKQIHELCAITGLPARYRDPSTGLGYANVLAYRKIRDLKEHQCSWSNMLGCYIGRAGIVARGVPDGFSAT